MINVFLPCRSGSERVPNKNIKPFSTFQAGLLQIKLKQLSSCKAIDNIYLSTNDDKIISYAKSGSFKKVKLIHRDDNLCSSSASTDDVIKHVSDIISEGHVLWTHVTSPFITSDVYENAIKKYFYCLVEGYDSLMSTTAIQTFLWDDARPLNYDRNEEKWPRTQTLPKVHEVNSGIFLNSIENYRGFSDRIGSKPYLYELDKICSFDIDWPADFVLAENMLDTGIASV